MIGFVIICLYICRWYKDGEFIPGESKFTLDIANLNRDDHRSILMCEGENAIGVSRATTTLDIECKNKDLCCELGVSMTTFIIYINLGVRIYVGIQK